MGSYDLFGGGLNFDHGAGQIIESAVVQVQGCGGLGVDGDDAAVHDVVLRHGAGLQDVQRHIGGVGAAMEPNELAAVAGRYRDMIYRVALHWCGHPQEAEDATQDTLLKLCTTHRHFADEEHLKSWLIRVTINHCKSRLRAPWHTHRLPLEELPDTPVFDDPAQRELYDAVLALPQAYRIVLYLFYYEDMPTREIAAVLHISQNAVTTRLTRAREALRRAYQED